METVQDHTKIAENLKEQAAFLKDKIDVYESDEEGRKRLETLVEALEQAAVYLEDYGSTAGRESQDESADVRTAEQPAVKPDSPEDTEGWLTYYLENPKDEDAVDNIQRLETKYRVAEDWDMVLTILMTKIEVEDEEEERLAQLQEMQRICEQEVGDLAKAFVAAQMTHALKPTDQEAIDNLLRLAEATEQWAELLEHLNKVITDVEDPKGAANLWLLAAQVYNERLGRVDYAATALGQGIEKDPKNPALWDELATLYKSNSQWTELASVLERRLEVEPAKDQQVFYLQELADIYESRIGDLVEARLRYERILELDPTNQDAINSLEGICRSLELWEPLLRVLKRKLDITDSPSRKTAIRLEMAALLADHLEDPDAAIKDLDALLQAEPHNQDALRRLLALYEEKDDTEAYLRTARKLADLTEDDDEKKKLLRRIVLELEVNPETRSETVEYLERLAELDPHEETIYRSLEKRYIEEESWQELAATYERHAQNAQSIATKVEIYKLLSALQEEQLDDLEAAESTIRKALEVDASDPEILAALSRVLRRSEKWMELVDVLTHRIDLADDDAARSELHKEIGEIAATKLGDPTTAEERLLKALELGPENLGAITTLFEFYKNQSHWLRAANMAEKAAELTVNPIQRADLLYEIGEIHREQLKDQEKSIQYYHRALSVDPEHLGSASRLADYYYEAEDWEQAEPVLDILARHETKDRKKEFLHAKRLGLVAKELKKVDKAIEHLETARELDPADLEVLEALADLRYKTEEWQASANLYQAILVGHRQDLSKQQLVELYHRLGTIKLNTDDKEKALSLFEKALDLDPEYEPSAQAVIHLRSEAEDYDKVVSAKEALLRKTKDPVEKHRLLVDIGDLYNERLNDPDMAVEYYEKALDLRADDHVTLHKLMELHTADERWDHVAQTILRLEAIEDDTRVKAKYHYAAGVIYRDELADMDLALEHFENCLELDPDNKQAFDAVERLLSGEQRWKDLARAYRRHFKRIAERADRETRVALLQKTGEIYLDKLGDTETAMAAFETAAQIDPSNEERNNLLAKLYLEAGPSKADKAIEIHQRLIRANPYHIATYKQLFDLYVQTQQKDKTWCLCSALTFLKQADEKQRIFYSRYRPKKFLSATRKLSDKLWQKNMAHSSENALLSGILAGIAVPAALLAAKPHKSFNLKRRERMDTAKDNRPLAQLFLYAADVMSITLKPEIYLRKDQLLPVQLANTRERNALVPSWLVDPDKFQGKSEAEIVFELSRHLTFQRPARFLKRALPSQNDLASALAAALVMMVPEAPVDKDRPEIRRFVEHYRLVVPPLVFEQLTPIAKKLVAAGRSAMDLRAWLKATELTSLQAAFTLSNDFALVSRLVAGEPDGVTGIKARDRITELLVFSVSEPYFQLREYLGFAID